MGLENTRWQMKLTQDGVDDGGETGLKFFFKVDTHDPNTGAIGATLTQQNGTPTSVVVPLKKAKGKPLPGSNTNFHLSFLISLGGLTAFVSGVVTGTAPPLRFDGVYTGASFDDPGDTGTGTGQQTT